MGRNRDTPSPATRARNDRSAESRSWKIGTLGGMEQFVESDRLNPEQKRSVEFVLDSRARAVSISGRQGQAR